MLCAKPANTSAAMPPYGWCMCANTNSAVYHSTQATTIMRAGWNTPPCRLSAIEPTSAPNAVLATM